MARPATLTATARLELKLPLDVKKRLVAEAAKRGTTAAALIVQALQRFFEEA